MKKIESRLPNPDKNANKYLLKEPVLYKVEFSNGFIHLQLGFSPRDAKHRAHPLEAENGLIIKVNRLEFVN